MKIDKQKIIKKIKSKLYNSKYINNILNTENISIDNLMDLKIVFENLDGKMAEANSKILKLDNKLLSNGEDYFFNHHMHFVIHELNHWVNRMIEKRWYFNDIEEVQSFIAAIAYEIVEGKDIKTIKDEIFPIIKDHFNNIEAANSFFNSLCVKAKKYIKKMNII